MNSQITTLDPVTTATVTKTILAKDGFTCALLTLAPGEATPRYESNQVEEHLLFVVEGAATVRFGEMNALLGKDQALLIRSGEAYTIAAQSNGRTKILRVDVPPRQTVVPQIVTFDR